MTDGTAGIVERIVELRDVIATCDAEIADLTENLGDRIGSGKRVIVGHEVTLAENVSTRIDKAAALKECELNIALAETLTEIVPSKPNLEKALKAGVLKPGLFAKWVVSKRSEEKPWVLKLKAVSGS